MALNGCSSGLLVTAAVALLLLPAHYYVPDLYGPEAPPQSALQEDAAPPFPLFDLSILHSPPLDLLVTITMLFLGLATYLCEWIQRKLMEKRILKLGERLRESTSQLRAWDAQHAQQEATLRMVRHATSEYNLLLFLLLRQRPSTTAHKDLDDLNFTRSSAPHEL